MSWITKLGNKCHILYHLRNASNANKILQRGMQKPPLLSSQVHTLQDFSSSKILQILHVDIFKRHYQVHNSGKDGYQIFQKTYLHSSSCKTNKKIDTSQVPVLNEEDLEESFVRGSGPGGQSVNRTSSACMLKHIPTGLVVKCHEDRNLHKNRITARKWMVAKLDQLYNGDMSVAAQQKRMQEEKNAKAQQKARKKQMMKKAWKEREGLTEN